MGGQVDFGNLSQFGNRDIEFGAVFAEAHSAGPHLLGSFFVDEPDLFFGHYFVIFEQVFLKVALVCTDNESHSVRGPVDTRSIAGPDDSGETSLGVFR